jgi:serine O-acetyltransferase
MNYTFKEYVRHEVINKSKNTNMSISRVMGRLRIREYNFIFWYRASYVLHRKNTFLAKKVARYINDRIRFKFCCDIHRESEIGIGLKIDHLSGIVINPNTSIGGNFRIFQNKTIGTAQLMNSTGVIIGDNVMVGANSCIIGNGIKIGSDVNIGAMSFVNKSIDDGLTYITIKESNTKTNPSRLGSPQ